MTDLIVENVGENTRVFKFDDKEVELIRDEQTALWSFSWTSGEPPARLSGAFTNVRTAYEFLYNYLGSLTPKVKKNTQIKEV